MAIWAAFPLVLARLSSPNRTRSRTSRARRCGDLGGRGGSIRGHGTDSVGEGEHSGDIRGRCGEELPEATFEKGPHTGLEGISGKVTMAFNPTSACGAPKG